LKFLREILLIVCFATNLVAHASLNFDQKVEQLLSRMTLDEKVGQMVPVDAKALKDKEDIQKYFLGSVLSGGDSDPTDNTARNWLQAVNECQRWALKTRLGIPLLYGIDAVHGHNNVDGAVIFPHNIGLGTTHDPKLVEEAEHVTAMEMAGTSITINYQSVPRRRANHFSHVDLA
jgi:beta-glucosidase